MADKERKVYVEVLGLLVFLIPKAIDLYTMLRREGVEVPGQDEVDRRIAELRSLPDLPEGNEDDDLEGNLW